MIEINYECIRDILIHLETYLGYASEKHDRIRLDWKTIFNNEELIEIYEEPDVIRYNLEKMYEMNFLDMYKYHKLPSGRVDNFIVEDITPLGYQFLDMTQNENTWTQTKKALKNYGGEGYKFLSTIGIQVVSAIIKQQMGL